MQELSEIQTCLDCTSLVKSDAGAGTAGTDDARRLIATEARMEKRIVAGRGGWRLRGMGGGGGEMQSDERTVSLFLYFFRPLLGICMRMNPSRRTGQKLMLYRVENRKLALFPLARPTSGPVRLAECHIRRLSALEIGRESKIYSNCGVSWTPSIEPRGYMALLFSAMVAP